MKNKSGMVFLVLLCFMLALSPQTYSCSSFKLQKKDNLVFGYNFDWHPVKGFVVINKRNMVKTAFLPGNENPATWKSKYGSITFNAFGKEFPLTGMNETGLTMSLMWLDVTQYPDAGDLQITSELQWVQYQLDNASTVKEVIASLDHVTISKNSIAPLHFLVCDSTGNAATIEFLGGKPIVHSGDKLPVSMLTNTTYSRCAAYLAKKNSTGKTNSESLNRFIKGASRLQDYPQQQETPIVDYAFGILDHVKRIDTRWTFIFDIENRQVFYKTYRNNFVRSVNLNSLNFECNAPDLVMNIDDNTDKGFTAYTTEQNMDLLRYSSTLDESFTNVPTEFWQGMARYPESLHCAD